jgi:hypothetical protein
VCGFVCLKKGGTQSSQRMSWKTRNCIVFLVSGIKRFSRSELTNHTPYFDSRSDVLKR